MASALYPNRFFIYNSSHVFCASFRRLRWLMSPGINRPEHWISKSYNCCCLLFWKPFSFIVFAVFRNYSCSFIHSYFCSFLKLPFTPLPLLGVFRNAIGCLFWQIQLLMCLWRWWEGANGVNWRLRDVFKKWIPAETPLPLKQALFSYISQLLTLYTHLSLALVMGLLSMICFLHLFSEFPSRPGSEKWKTSEH